MVCRPIGKGPLSHCDFKVNNSFEGSVTRANVLSVNFVTEHNLSFQLLTTSPILNLVCFQIVRLLPNLVQHAPKTTCIVKGELYPYFTMPVESMCCDGPFSILLMKVMILTASILLSLFDCGMRESAHPQDF